LFLQNEGIFMRDVVIVGMARTPIGNFLGTLSGFTAPKLGALAIEAAMKRAGINPDQVSEVIMGNVLQAGMKAIMMAAQSIWLGDSDIAVAGGMESMSNAPYIVQNARNGFRMGSQTFVDAMIYDGLWDPYSNQHMGNCGEICAKEYHFTREMQDAFAIETYKRAQAAQKEGKFRTEIVPVEIVGRKGEKTLIESDEGPGKAQFDKIPTLKPAFDKAGTVTAANASPVNDGAAAVVMMSAEKARELGLKPLAKLVSYGTFAQEPSWFTTAPAEAMRRALKKANWEVGSVDVIEVNEAFAVVAMAAQKDLALPEGKINAWGGAIAIGHPLGASGARLAITAIAQMMDKKKSRALTGICIGGGEATALCLELA
jgi:acetyl-CoA C-acetyltransferase